MRYADRYIMAIPKEVIERLAKLKKTIEKHRYNYHVLGKEEISAEALYSLKNPPRLNLPLPGKV